MSVAVSTNNAVARRARAAAAREPDARVASAPAVVDVMGGLGESAGSLTLVATLRTAIVVAACPRTDGLLEIRPMAAGGEDSPLPVSMPMTALAQVAVGDGPIRLPDALPRLTPQTEPVVAMVCSLLATGLAPRLLSGLTIDCQLADTDAFVPSAASALAAASLEAILALASPGAERGAILAACERLVRWSSLRHAGLRAVMAALVGQPHSMLQFRRQAQQAHTYIELPVGVALAVIEVHPARPIGPQRVAQAQFAAAMGHRMIQELARTDPAIAAVNGCLTSLSPNDYVERVRDRLASKIIGKTFLQRYGDFAEAAGVEPARAYKPRSRAEHHIYENQRVHDFVACIVRARRATDAAPLIQAGELMYASHWSHSQRCGLGSVETDAITQYTRRHGPAAGLFGSKLAGGWDDGLMVVLMRDDATARAALDDVAALARKRFGGPFRVLTGSDAGASLNTAASAAPAAAS